jgi:hypothetical protein
MPSIIFDGWREEGKRYWYGGAYIYKYEVSVKWTVYNDLNTAIFLLPRITGFGVDTGYLQGHVINPNQTYNGECGHEFDWIEGAEDDVTIEYVYSLNSYNPPYYDLGSASKHVIMPNYPEQPPPSQPPPSQPPSEQYPPPKVVVSGCFIVSALGENELVAKARAWRDERGIWFKPINRLYYAFSPNIAMLIRKHKRVKKTAKFILTPIIKNIVGE